MADFTARVTRAVEQRAARNTAASGLALVLFLGGIGTLALARLVSRELWAVARSGWWVLRTVPALARVLLAGAAVFWVLRDPWFAIPLTCALVGLLVWPRIDKASFRARIAGPARAVAIRRAWTTLAESCGLGVKTGPGWDNRPRLRTAKLRKATSTGQGMGTRLEVSTVPGQTPADVTAAVATLAAATDSVDWTITSTGPSTVTVDLVAVEATEGGEVEVDEMRAFSLYFDEIPVIMLNGADATRGRTFSLLHEYVHLLFHTEGLCDTTTDTRAVTADRALEARCNAVAAAILLPREAVLASRLVAEHGAGEPWSIAELIDAARPFGVSAEAFLRRLVTLGRVPLSSYRQFRHLQESRNERSRASGGNFYTTKVRDLGKGYVRRVTDAHRRALIDTASAATYLDVKAGQIARLARASQVAR